LLYLRNAGPLHPCSRTAVVRHSDAAKTLWHAVLPAAR